MRYSRFKKQIEGGSTTSRRPRATPASPKKPRGPKKEKDSPSKRVKTEGRRTSGSAAAIKHEQHGESQEQASTRVSDADCEMQDEIESEDLYTAHDTEIRVKHEPGMRSSIRADSVFMMPTPNPSTPRYSPSPSPSQSAAHSFQTSISDLDLMNPFGMPGYETAPGYLRSNEFDRGYTERTLYDNAARDEYLAGAGGSGGNAYGNLLGGLSDLPLPSSLPEHHNYGMWNHGASGNNRSALKGENMEVTQVREGDVLVKTEPRWEEAYRQL